MRLTPRIALLLISVLLLTATFGMSQTNLQQYVRHVIIVVQENRTPDNLFNEDSTLAANGGHVQPQFAGEPANSGKCEPPGGQENYLTLQPTSFYICWDPDHSHGGAWTSTWDSGAMDGACNATVHWRGSNYCGSQEPACVTNGPNGSSTCQYAYVDNTAFATPPIDRILDPYFQIANSYGFANYMFQTSQGPSFPAHQFLLSGTSAPVSDDGDANGYWKWFAAENNTDYQDTQYGCTADSNASVLEIDPSGNESNGYNSGYPCYNHATLADLLDSNGVSWRYYAQTAKSLWTAPNAIQNICGASGGSCQGQDWKNNVKPFFPNQGNYVGDYAPILTDIQNCNLPQVSWVIPDGNWSDHAGQGNSPGDGRPSWVAAVVNQVGQATNCDGSGYWNDTVILITWDDWGGWYDDVVPPDCSSSPCTGYSNNTGQQYVYGFRVPLLVVGAYTKQVTSTGGYVSGPPSNPSCLNTNYCHDFGSILQFVEYAFGTGGQFLAFPKTTPWGISPSYPYADYWAMDGPITCTGCNYSLSDFFNFSQGNFHAFQTVIGTKYSAACFHNAAQCFGSSYPQDPDDDAESD